MCQEKKGKQQRGVGKESVIQSVWSQITHWPAVSEHSCEAASQRET